MVSFKPGAKISTHLLVAAAIWSGVGLMLMVRGALALNGAGWLILGLVAVPAGVLKSKFVLDKVALRNMDRILSMGDDHCIGGVYSVGTWMLVAVMILMGLFLRKSSIVPLTIVGFIYVTVGCGLFGSSRLIWKKWYEAAAAVDRA